MWVDAAKFIGQAELSRGGGRACANQRWLRLLVVNIARKFCWHVPAHAQLSRTSVLCSWHLALVEHSSTYQSVNDAHALRHARTRTHCDLGLHFTCRLCRQPQDCDPKLTKCTYTRDSQQGAHVVGHCHLRVRSAFSRKKPRSNTATALVLVTRPARRTRMPESGHRRLTCCSPTCTALFVYSRGEVLGLGERIAGAQKAPGGKTSAGRPPVQ